MRAPASWRPGLGVSIARQYATAHGDSIVYEEGERAGARFRVVLPRSARRGAGVKRLLQ